MDSTTQFVLEARALSKTYTQGRWWQRKFHCHALDNVSLTLRPAETLALVGESGCGKTTLAMCLVGLEKPDAGEVLVNGATLQRPPRSEQSFPQREVQLIFQDSTGALNPRMPSIEIVEEPLLILGRPRFERRTAALVMMERVGIPSHWKDRLPHELSGGQRQRLAVARALVLDPKVLILDEVFVGLDLSIQAQVANLLLDLQEERGLSYMCISHNLALAGQLAHRIAVMHQGRIVKEGSADEFLKYSNNSMAATPSKSLGAYSGA